MKLDFDLKEYRLNQLMSATSIPLKRCSKCKCTLVIDKYFEINRKGEYYKTCNGCRQPKPKPEKPPYIKPEVIERDDGFRSLADHPDLEVNESGEVRFIRTKKQPRGLKYNDKFNSLYVRYSTENFAEQKGISMFNLVAQCFLDNPNGYKFVQAKDGNNSNCKASNLEWVKARRRRPKDEDDDC